MQPFMTNYLTNGILDLTKKVLCQYAEGKKNRVPKCSCSSFNCTDKPERDNMLARKSNHHTDICLFLHEGYKQSAD